MYVAGWVCGKGNTVFSTQYQLPLEDTLPQMVCVDNADTQRRRKLEKRGEHPYR